MTFYTDINVGIKKAGSMNYLIYDEVKLQITGDFSIDNEVITGTLKSFDF